MFGLSKEEKKRAQTRERVKRCREKKKGVAQDVTESVTPEKVSVTPKDKGVTKMVCRCQYFRYVDGQLVCSQCGRPSRKVEDKIKRGIQVK